METLELETTIAEPTEADLMSADLDRIQAEGCSVNWSGRDQDDADSETLGSYLIGF